MKNIYFSQNIVNNVKNDINLKFSKITTKKERLFLKLLFFKIISYPESLNKLEIELNEIITTLNLDSVKDFNIFLKKLMEKQIFFEIPVKSGKYSGSFALISSFIINTNFCQIFFTDEFKYCFSNQKNIFSLLEIEKFIFNAEKDDFSLYVWRCIPYKKFDLIVDAFNKNWKKIIIVTNTDNKLYRKLKSISKENISWKLNIKREEIYELYSKAKAFLFPPEEDFWLVPIEAMASGTPVIAYWKGGALETVVSGKTWIFFSEQTINSLNKAIEEFEKMSFDANEIRDYSKNFDKKIFKENILKFIEEKLENKKIPI